LFLTLYAVGMETYDFVPDQPSQQLSHDTNDFEDRKPTMKPFIHRNKWSQMLAAV